MKLLMRRQLKGDFCFAKEEVMSAFSHPHRTNSRTFVDAAGRTWILQIDTLNGEIYVVTNCPCGCTMETAVSTINRGLEVSSDILCKLPREKQIHFLKVPEELTRDATERANKRWNEGCQVRHEGGGDGSWYPL
ncbi:hypothetical protein HYV69_00715 [Candidatus Uhrbacteria bacterium]|nr:hypothetical protein [Candidatus Uhrbacteria bacterium]